MFKGFNERMRKEREEKFGLGLDAADTNSTATGLMAKTTQLDLYADLGENNPKNSTKSSLEERMREIEEKKSRSEQEHIDRLKYIHFVKTNKYSVKQILKTEVHDRSPNEHFFLRQYLKLNVPFFANYEGSILSNICN